MVADGYEGICWENCSSHEEWKSVWISGWAYYFVTGVVLSCLVLCLFAILRWFSASCRIEEISNYLVARLLHDFENEVYLHYPQIENEYGPQAKLLGAPGHNYATWAANMAVALDTGVPWVMCKEEDAPDPVVW